MGDGFDSVVLIGFGGPTRGCCRRHADCPGEAYCYVEGIVGDRAGGAERIREVAAHYAHFGGVSPFSFFSQKQAGALEMALEAAGVHVPVHVGYRFWHPYVRDALADMHRNGARRALGVVLAPHRSKVSWEAYQAEVRSAREALGGAAPEVAFMDAPWFDGEGYLRAAADRVREAMAGEPEGRFRKAHLIFTAHSIPVSMAKASPYADEFAATAAGVARTLGVERYAIGYQSSPDVPPGTWLGPDVVSVIQEAAEAGAEDVLLSPVGFICDHVEVLFDLDVEAREAAEACGLGFFRAPTVGTHPAFIGMLRDRVAEWVTGSRA